MEQVSTGDSPTDLVGARRTRMRDRARTHRQAPGASRTHFHTPVWLERSFVLPLLKPEPTDVPEPRPHHTVPQQPVAQASTAQAPTGRQPEPSLVSHHGLPSGDLHAPAPAFVRPPSEDIDFSAVIRRADLSRSALRTAWLACSLAGLLLILFLLTGVPAVAVVAAVCAVVAVSATLVRIRLVRAPVPRLQP